MGKLEPVVIDPRRHDAVLFDVDAVAGSWSGALDSTPSVAGQLHKIGVATTIFSAQRGGGFLPTTNSNGDVIVVQVDTLADAVARMEVRPGRSAVVATDAAGVAAGRAQGFALVIGLASEEEPAELGDADAVITDLKEITVRTGDRRMSELPDALAAQHLAADLAAANPAVFFDFDGTLSDIVDDPDTATPVAGATEALRHLAARCPVAVLSGRDLADVTKRVGVPGIWYAGSHGFELTAPDGTHHQNDAAAEAIPLLEQAAAQLREQLQPIPGVAVEHKRFGVAVHYRNAGRDRVGEVMAAVRAAGRRDALRVTTGREVIELRPDLDWDKGKTLHWVIDHLGRDLTPVYLGDDITDEDAFDAVRAGPVQGVPILVRHNDDGDRATAALFALDSPAQASEFVDRLASELGH